MEGSVEGVVRKKNQELDLEGRRGQGNSEKLGHTTLQLSAGKFYLLQVSEEPDQRDKEVLYQSNTPNKPGISSHCMPGLLTLIDITPSS